MKQEFFSSYRPPIGSAYTPGNNRCTLDLVFKVLSGNGLKEWTEKLRDLLSEGKEEEYKDLKKTILPSVTFGGVFDYRSTNKTKLSEERKRGLLSPSGLVILDIDHISQTGTSLEDLKERISEDREIGVRLVFTSPSGDGLKVVCKTSSGITDPQTYKEVYNRLRHYMTGKYGDIVDRSGSDISRLCLLCYDPTAVLRDWEDVFNPEDHPLPEVKRSPAPSYSSTFEDLGDGIEEIVRRVESSGLDIAPEYGEYLKLVYSFTALGERGREYLHRVCSLSPKYDPEDTDRDFDNCMRSGESQSIGTFINIAKSMGIDVTKPVEIPEKRRRSTPEEDFKDVPETPSGTPSEGIQKESEKESKYRKYLEIPDLSEVVEGKREGIRTRYRFGENKRKEEYLTLRSGAMTLICGKSSHGKSKLLQNLALQISRDIQSPEEEGSVLFFTYEEELSEVLLQFANIYTNVPGLSQYDTPNTEVLQDYFKTGDIPRCTERKREEILPKLADFKTFYKSGKLRVFYSDLYSQDLCDLVRYLSSQIKIKAVFVDYVQLLYRDHNRKDRKEEIKDICNDLRKVAIDLSLPLVLSAQLNRETANPTDMSEDNIADSADLTRYANTIVCLWSSYFDNVKGGKSVYLQTEDGKRLQSRGFTLGEGGKIYAKITKNRGGTPYIDTILSFTGETGYIPDNDDLPGGLEDYGEDSFKSL